MYAASVQLCLHVTHSLLFIHQCSVGYMWCFAHQISAAAALLMHNIKNISAAAALLMHNKKDISPMLQHC